MITLTRICESCGRAFKQAWIVDRPMEAICRACKDGDHAH